MMALLSLPAGLQGASPRICALGLWSYTAMARPMSFFPASSFADRAARYSRAASRTAAPLSSQNTMSHDRPRSVPSASINSSSVIVWPSFVLAPAGLQGADPQHALGALVLQCV
jgi:hypothetical protein